MHSLIHVRCYFYKLGRCRDWGGFFRNEKGIAVALFALAMPVIFGTIGLAVDVSNWYMHRRSMQNAADAAAIAAATAASNKAAEAQAVAAQLGYTNGSGNVSVQTTSAPCTGAQKDTCYTVTITDKVASFFSRVIRSSNGPTALSASAMAANGPDYPACPYCILALNGKVTNDFTTNGAPKANLNGCNIMANSDATCNGHNLNANIGDAHGTNSGCGVIQHSNMPMISDPYSNLASNIPTDSCGGTYYHEPTKKSGTALPASNQWSGHPGVQCELLFRYNLIPFPHQNELRI